MVLKSPPNEDILNTSVPSPNWAQWFFAMYQNLNSIESGDINISTTISETVIDYQITSEDFTILLNGSDVKVTATLPDPTDLANKIYNIKCINDTNKCDVKTNLDAEKIDGDISNFNLAQDESITVQTDGKTWWII